MVLQRNRMVFLSAGLVLALAVATAYGFPSVYPTGTTIYNPEKTWNGYTIYPAPEAQGGVLIDMNGNTLITEGAAGRAFEVTVDHEIVWEFINPFFYESDDTRHNFYRAYRVPYDWIPQLTPPEARPVVPPNLSDFRIEKQ